MPKMRVTTEGGAVALRRRRVDLLPYALCAPAIIMVLLAIGYSIVSNIWTSFHNGHLSDPRANEWVGLEHYLAVVQDPELRQIALNSLLIAGSTALLSLLVGFAWAIGLNQSRRFKSGFQVLVLTPWILSGVITARLWIWLLDPIFGILNNWLVRFILHPLFGYGGNLEITSSLHLAGASVVIAAVWRLFPFVFVMILAGLQSIPQELYEAAMVDGASPAQRFRHITLPFLRFVLAIVTLLSFVWSFNDFSIIVVMTKGGPGYATMVLPFRVYRFIIQGFRLGIGAALSLVMVVFLLVVAILYVRLLRRQSEEGSLA